MFATLLAQALVWEHRSGSWYPVQYNEAAHCSSGWDKLPEALREPYMLRAKQSLPFINI